jgi:hypothetical protein
MLLPASGATSCSGAALPRSPAHLRVAAASARLMTSRIDGKLDIVSPAGAWAVAAHVAPGLLASTYDSPSSTAWATAVQPSRPLPRSPHPVPLPLLMPRSASADAAADEWTASNARFLAAFAKERKREGSARRLQAWWRAQPTRRMYRFLVACRRRTRTAHLRAWHRTRLAVSLHRRAAVRKAWQGWWNQASSTLDVRTVLTSMGEKFMFAKTPVSTGSYMLAVHIVLSPRGQEVMKRPLLSPARVRELLAPYLAAAGRGTVPPVSDRIGGSVGDLRGSCGGGGGSGAGGREVKGVAAAALAARVAAAMAPIDDGRAASFPTVRLVYRKGLAALGVRAKGSQSGSAAAAFSEALVRASESDETGAGVSGVGRAAAAASSAAEAAMGMASDAANVVAHQVHDALQVLQHNVEFHVKRAWFDALRATLAARRALIQRAKFKLQQVARALVGSDVGWDTSGLQRVFTLWHRYAAFRAGGKDVAAVRARFDPPRQPMVPVWERFLQSEEGRRRRAVQATALDRLGRSRRAFARWRSWQAWRRRAVPVLQVAAARWRQRQLLYALGWWRSQPLSAALAHHSLATHFRAWWRRTWRHSAMVQGARWLQERQIQRSRAAHWRELRTGFLIHRRLTAMMAAKLQGSAADAALPPTSRTTAMQVVLSAREDATSHSLSAMITCWNAWKAYAHRRKRWVQLLALYRMDAARYLARFVFHGWAAWAKR